MLIIRLMACAGFTACTHDDVPDVADTREACSADNSLPITNDIPVLTYECRKLIARDLNIVQLGFDDQDVYTSLIEGAWSLMAHDWDRPLLYERVVSSFSRTRYSPRPGAPASVNGRTLIIRLDLGEPYMAASILYHEAIHASSGGSADHVRCSDGQRDCDRGPFWAYGGQVLLLEDGLRSAEADPEAWATMNNHIVYIRNERIIE